MEETGHQRADTEEDQQVSWRREDTAGETSRSAGEERTLTGEVEERGHRRRLCRSAGGERTLTTTSR